MDTTSAPPIQRSWQRCFERGQRTTDGPVAVNLPNGPSSHLLSVARSSIEDLYQLIERPGFAVALADAQAVLMHLEGDPAVVTLARSCGLVPPVDISEARTGCNAVDLALREALPFQTVGVEHYSAQLRPLAIAAAPIFDVDGRPLGALAILTAAEGAHIHTLGLAIATAQALHNQLRADQLLADANDQLAELYATLETMSEGLIFIGPGNEIRRINSRAAEILGVSARTVAGRPFAQALALPEMVRQALHEHAELVEYELLWHGRKVALPALCSVRPVWTRARRYLGTLITIRPAQSVHQLVQRVVGAQAQFTFHDIIGQSPAILQALHQAHMAAGASGAVMLSGEPGVGKEIFAQAIHNASSRARGPFVRLNCATVPRTLLGSELFGVEGGPRSSDRPGRPGKIELAYGGLLYLEEVGVLSSELQTGLLRAIEMKRIIRTGGVQPLPIDVRIIVTCADLDRQVQEGRFRADLAARLSAFSVEIPPLRARGDDLLLLINHLLLLLSDRLGRQVAFAPDALQAMRAYPWPGNVRELELTIERVLHSGEKSVIDLEDLPPAIVHVAAPMRTPDSPSLDDSNRLSEREAILRAGHQSVGHLGRTADLLGISRATLWRKMVRYGITKADFWPAAHT
ncbi:MAG: sigma 54-interacting transcriptional regulator [Chloroflexales bacterium]